VFASTTLDDTPEHRFLFSVTTGANHVSFAFACLAAPSLVVFLGVRMHMTHEYEHT
jgi:hypothetical protein